MERGEQLYLGLRDTDNGTNRRRYLATTPPYLLPAIFAMPFLIRASVQTIVSSREP